jgi:hypothetical protein
MLKVINIALILAVAAIAIAAKQYMPSDAQRAAPAAAASVAPMDMMRDTKPLPQTEVENYN